MRFAPSSRENLPRCKDMTESPAPPAQPVDGIVPPSPPAVPTGSSPTDIRPGPPPGTARLFKQILLVIIGVPYLAYVLWSVYLLLILPDPTGARDALIPQGTMIALVVAVLFLGIGAFTLLRIGAAEDIPLPRRRLAAIKVVLVVLPGLLLSGFVPLLIRREPPLSITIVSPLRAEEFVAPLSVTFSARDAVDILARRQLEAAKFAWDFEGDGKLNAETTEPEVTAAYDKQGTYPISLVISLKSGAVRRISRTLVITSAVFSVDPVQPIMDEPARLSIAHLVSKREDLEQAEWDFDGNGEADLVTKELEVVHTFYGDGPTRVSVKVTLMTKAVQTFARTLDVLRTAPMPFPVTFTSDPEHLLGTPPFGAVFRVDTAEPLRVTLWTFGDGAEARGVRAAHTFTQQGIFPVTAELRSLSGSVTKITKVVRVTQELQLTDLSFSGSPDVRNNKISGEVPVIVDLKPHTNMPLVEFFWEAPDATSVGETKDSVQAVYRREGVYTLWLIGQDADGKVLRRPITIEVLPPVSAVTIRMDPDGGTAPLAVRLDASETVIRDEQISGFEWTFSDEPQGDSHQQGAQVSHVFQKPGTYEISAKVFTTSGKEFSSQKTIVVRAPVISACITASRMEGRVPLGVQFKSSECSTFGAQTQFTWDFGDGAQSDQRDPIHDFQIPGEYTVTLTLRDGDSVVISDPLPITAQP